jgi:hypothetical protein
MDRKQEKGASFRVISIDREKVEAKGGELRMTPEGIELMIPECHRPEAFDPLVEILKRDFGLDDRGVDSAIEHILEEQTMLWVRDLIRDRR